MTKCVVSIGYKNFVLDAEKALGLVDLLADAEVYEEKWHSETKDNTYHIYPNEGHTSAYGVSMELKMLSNKFYQMAKLAGKPKKGE
jgi:hypothetical protein